MTITTDTTTRARSSLPTATRKPRLSRALKVDFWLDMTLLVAFIAAESFHLTGLVLHEWLGVAMAAALLAHITLHWNWVARTTARLFRKKPGRDTILWANNLFLMLAMTMTVASGLWSSRVVLTTFGLAEGQEDFWLQVHFWCADLSLFSVALHIALGWRWILTTGKRIVRRPSTPRTRSTP